jgi:hypothetical protein
VPRDLWEAVLDLGPLFGSDIGRLRLALDTLADAADLLDLAKWIESLRSSPRMPASAPPTRLRAIWGASHRPSPQLCQGAAPPPPAAADRVMPFRPHTHAPAA